jgi:type IV secretion system protein TrbL
MSLVLAAITLLGLGIYGPAIATGLVSGAPQLGAGAAIGTAGAVAGAALLTAGGALGGARLLGAAGSGGLGAIRAGTAMGSAASTAYGLGQAGSGSTGVGGVGAGLGGVARAGGGVAAQRARSIVQLTRTSLGESAQAGRDAAWRATGGAAPYATAARAAGNASGDSASASPEWARRLQAEQRARHNRQIAGQAIKDGDRPGAPANPELDQEED